MGDRRLFLSLIPQESIVSSFLQPCTWCGADILFMVVNEGLISTEELSGRDFGSSTDLRES